MSASVLAHACLQAYVDKDRARAEALISDDFHFTSPLDNALDRTGYFERCWPTSDSIQAMRVVTSVDTENSAFVIYEATTRDGKRFRNCELHTAREDQLISVEVYFGWDLPHPAVGGGFIDHQGGQA